jgi:hypothetical protein
MVGAAFPCALYLSPLRGERSTCERDASKSGEGPGTTLAASGPLTRLATLATLSPLARGEGRSAWQ